MRMMDSTTAVVSTRPRRRKRAIQEQRFTSYLSFGLNTTVCIGIFILFYIVTLVVLSPLLHQEAPTSASLKRGQVLKPALQKAVEKVKHNMPHHLGSPGQMMAEGMAGVIQHKLLEGFRHEKGVTDAQLMQRAAEELGNLRKQKQAQAAAAVVAADTTSKSVVAGSAGKRTGFIVLGMHRSGTSMLAGLMKMGLGYETGKPLIGGAFDNEKGFFELIAAVYQNDEVRTQSIVFVPRRRLTCVCHSRINN